MKQGANYLTRTQEPFYSPSETPKMYQFPGHLKLVVFCFILKKETPLDISELNKLTLKGFADVWGNVRCDMISNNSGIAEQAAQCDSWKLERVQKKNIDYCSRCLSSLAGNVKCNGLTVNNTNSFFLLDLGSFQVAYVK